MLRSVLARIDAAIEASDEKADADAETEPGPHPAPIELISPLRKSLASSPRGMT